MSCRIGQHLGFAVWLAWFFIVLLDKQTGDIWRGLHRQGFSVFKTSVLTLVERLEHRCTYWALGWNGLCDVLLRINLNWLLSVLECLKWRVVGTHCSRRMGGLEATCQVRVLELANLIELAIGAVDWVSRVRDEAVGWLSFLFSSGILSEHAFIC